MSESFSLRIANNCPRQVMFVFEPWAEEFLFPSSSHIDILIKGEIPTKWMPQVDYYDVERIVFHDCDYPKCSTIIYLNDAEIRRTEEYHQWIADYRNKKANE